MEALLDRIAGLPPAGIYAVVALLAALENFFPPVPADVTVALGAFLAARGVVNIWAIYAITVAANVLGAIAVFEAAKHYGRRFLESRLGRRLVSEKGQARIRRLYDRYHLLGITITRMLPVYRTLIPPFAAATGLPFRKTIPPVLLGTAAYYGVLCAVAYGIGHNWDAVKAVVGRIGVGLVIAAAVITVLGIYLWKRHHRDEPDA